MAKARGVDARLARLRALRHESPVPEHVPELRTALADKSNLVVAEAAEIVGSRLLRDLAPELVAAFDRFMTNPAESDKLCKAKFTIIETLNKIEYEDEAVFLRGIKHVQMEPRWGGAEDSAGELRGSSAFGLVRISYRDIVVLLADLLADSEKVARLAAAQALGATRSLSAIPLLRFKARIGDKESEVVGECLTALMVAAPKESLAFVAEFLHSSDEADQQAAAFALAESRRPEALAVLTAFWPKARSASFQEVILVAISTTRLPASIDFLLGILGGDEQPAAMAALSALAIHRNNEAICHRIASAVSAKENPALQERFKKKFAVTK
jgi:HEAT repeat protein